MPAGAGTRRTLLKSSLAGLGGLTVLGLDGCGSSLRPFTVSPQTRAADAELLNTALSAEQRSIAAYTAAAPLLGGFGQAMASQFLSQELAHAGILGKLIRQLGAKPRNSRTYDFGHPQGRAEILSLLHGLERDQITAYMDAIPRLSTPYLRQAAAAIMANDAQHVTVLRAQQGKSPMTGPFLTTAE